MKKHTFLRISYGPRPATLLKKRMWHRCFPMTFAKFLGTSFLQNVSGRLHLLKLYYFTEYLFPLRNTVRIQENADHKNLSIWTLFTQWTFTWQSKLKEEVGYHLRVYVLHLQIVQEEMKIKRMKYFLRRNVS